MLEPAPARRQLIASQLARARRSLPSVVCGNFFVRLARCMSEPGAPAAPASSSSGLGSLSSSWSSASGEPLGGGGGGGAAAAAGRRQVEVVCQLRELDARTGRRLARRQLSRVREEQLECSVDSEGEERQQEEEEEIEERQHFSSFLRLQRPRASSSGRPLESGSAKPAPPYACYELFLIHQSDLVVHKAQIALEAQLLARRLDQLLQSAEPGGGGGRSSSSKSAR